MHTIFFGNTVELTAADRECQVPGGFWPAMAVYDALCLRFLRVIVYDADGNIVRSYNNI